MQQLMKRYGWDSPLSPMAAKDAKDKKEQLMKSGFYVAEEKIDGARYLGVDGRLFSRQTSGKTGMPVEKTDNVPHIVQELSAIPAGTVLDGEIHYPGQGVASVTSIMGALPKKAIERQALNPIKYKVFDILHYNGSDVTTFPWNERRKILERVYDNHLKRSKHISLSRVYTGDKYDFLSRIIDDGGEGIMLKNITGKYHQGKRPEHNWYKIKRNITSDVIIMGFEPGNGKYKGLIGSIIFGLYDRPGGEVHKVGACSGMDDAMRVKMSKSPAAFLGKVIEVSAMETTSSGALRHPQFVRMRDDKDPRMCINED